MPELRTWVLVSLCAAVCTGPADAQVILVELQLGQPEIRSPQEVAFVGTTNLPPGTSVSIACELTARPIPSWEGIRMSSARETATVNEDGTFRFVLREPERFKTGDYRVTSQVWVHSASFFGSIRPQTPDFYEAAGDHGERLQGPLVSRHLELFLQRVSITTAGRFTLCQEDPDAVALREKPLLEDYARAIDEAYQIHEQLRDRGLYTRWPSGDDLRANRIVVDYGLRVRQSRQLIDPIQTQEAYFLLTEAVDALDQTHYWACATGMAEQRVRYEKATEAFEKARRKLRTFLDTIP